jgi:3-hydroxyisobutyrate dehydrogenase-like beta-hydroxyacid dehydrogenase
VLGRPQAAAAGQLHVLAGGRARDLARVAELLGVFGARIWHVSGDPQVANVIKVAVNYTIIHSLQALAESTALVEAYDVPAPDFSELLAETLFGGVVHRTYGDLIARRAYRPAGFTVPLGAKDLRLAQETAAARGVALPSAATLDEVFSAALRRPGAELDDWAAIAEVTRRSTPIAEEQLS